MHLWQNVPWRSYLRAHGKVGDAIVLPEINAIIFEIKTNLLPCWFKDNPFYGRENDNPHAHINSFKRITSTLRFRNVPNDVIKLMMFPYSLEGAAKTWYEKEPPNSILTWEDLVTNEAWERFKELLRACPHHGFTELTQVDTFYNGLNDNEQDSLNAAAGGNLLSKTTREALNLIENKSKSRDKASNQMEKIFQIFQDLRFDISFVDALLLMPRFAPTIKSLLMNKEKLLELAKIPLNENCSVMLLKKLPNAWEFPASFLFQILSQGEIEGGNPTPTSEPFTFEFILEEIEAYLKEESISPEIDHADCNPEEDICLIEKLLNNDPFQLPPMDLKQSEMTEVKSLIEEPPELELKDLPSHLEYVFLEENDKLPVIIAKCLKNDKKRCSFKSAQISQKGHCLENHRYQGPWVSPVHCVPKKGGITVVANEENELISTRLVTGWRVCIDYRKLNEATRNDHFPLPFMDQMIERLAGNKFYCFLDRFSGYFKIPIDPQDQEKTTFTCPYGTFVYRRMPFGLCNAPGTFQRCMMAIFHDMIEKTMEVFRDVISTDKKKFTRKQSKASKHGHENQKSAKPKPQKTKAL
ncbi:reverse transcriptase domain-containing protein [Tanacetum coccineum]